MSGAADGLPAGVHQLPGRGYPLSCGTDEVSAVADDLLERGHPLSVFLDAVPNDRDEVYRRGGRRHLPDPGDPGQRPDGPEPSVVCDSARQGAHLRHSGA